MDLTFLQDYINYASMNGIKMISVYFIRNNRGSIIRFDTGNL